MGIAVRQVARATAASLLLLAASAQAADPPASTVAATPPNEAQARSDAEKRLSEGLQRYARGDYEGARLAFAQAYAVLSSIDLLYNLSRAEVRSGHSLEALVHLHQIMRDPKATPLDLDKASRLLEEANRVTGHVAVEAPAGTEIVVDKVPSGEAPLREPFDVTPGKHTVEARMGANVRTIEVNCSVGDIVTARFALDTTSAPTVSAPVPIVVPPPPPVTPRSEPPPRDDRSSPAPHGSRESKARIIVPLVLGGAAVIAFGVGALLGLDAQSKETDATDFRASHAGGFCADRASGACTQYASILDSQQQSTTISRVMFVTGGVLAVGAIATYAVWPRSRSESRGAWIAPAPGGVRLGVTF